MENTAAYPIDRLLRNPLVFFSGLGGVAVIALALLAVLFPLYRPLLESQFPFSIVTLVVVLSILLGGTAMCILAERKISAWIQDRYGPNRVGVRGLLQPVADGLKMLLKEDFIPAHADRALFILAPGLSFGVAMLGFAVIPWAGDIHWPWLPAGQLVSTQVANLDVGFLYIVAVASMGIYGIILAGYASNNKYSFYGSMRAAAQMISYEIPLGLGLLCILLTTGTLRLNEIVNQQTTGYGLWYIFYHPLAFLLILVSAFAETNRLPFDLAESEQELVGGYHTEYSALKFGLFYLGEYAHMMTNSALMIALFFGGWEPIPFTALLADNHAWWAALIKFGVYWGKIAAFIVLYMAVRWTLPRFRFDQLMRIAWTGMVPMGVGLVGVTAVLVVLDQHQSLWWCLAANVVVFIAGLAWAARSKAPVTGRQVRLREMEAHSA